MPICLHLKLSYSDVWRWAERHWRWLCALSFFFSLIIPRGEVVRGETEQAAGRTSDDWNGFWVDVHDELGEKVHTDLLSLRGRITTQVSHWLVARVTDMTSDVLTAMELLCVVLVGQWHQWLASWDEGGGETQNDDITVPFWWCKHEAQKYSEALR